jgi:hypothetical protein
MRIEETAVIGTGKRASGQRIGVSGVIAAVLLTLLLGGIAMRELRTTHVAVPSGSQVVPSARMKFLENNTTNLPNAVTEEIRPVITAEEQKFLDENTVWLPSVTDAAPASTTAQRWFLDVNTTMLPQSAPVSAYMENLTPPTGQNR